MHIVAFDHVVCAQDITASLCAGIRHALTVGKVVCIPHAGDWMTPADQMRVASLLGVVDPAVSCIPPYVYSGVHQSAHADAAADGSQNTIIDANKAWTSWRGHAVPAGLVRLVREPGDSKSFGEGFHADQTYLANPPRYTFLLGRELPGGGDDTSFIDMKRAYDTLPVAVKRQLRDRVALHHDSDGRQAYHPVTRRVAGDRVFSLNCHFVHRIVGDDADNTLLRRCLAHIDHQAIARFKWDGRHALIWDNHQVVHSAGTDYALNASTRRRRRELHRVVVQDAHTSRL